MRAFLINQRDVSALASTEDVAKAGGQSKSTCASADNDYTVLLRCHDLSRVEPALLTRHENALAGNGEGRGAQRDLMTIGRVPDLAQCVDHDLV